MLFSAVFAAAPPLLQFCRHGVIFDVDDVSVCVNSLLRVCEFIVPCVGRSCDQHHQFDSSKSRTYKPGPHGEKLSIQYLSGKIEGPLGRDTVGIGSFAVPDQFFGAAEQIDVPLLDIVEWDGIVGLAFPNPGLAGKGVVPIFDQMLKVGLVPKDKHFFAYYLGGGGEGGALTFASVDRERLHETELAKPQCGSGGGGGGASHSKRDGDGMSVGKGGRIAVSGGGSAADDVDALLAGCFEYVPVTKPGFWTIQILDLLVAYDDKNAPVPTGICKGKPDSRCVWVVGLVGWVGWLV